MADPYHSHTQQARVVTEDWVSETLYCLNCGKEELEFLGKKALDFTCNNCAESYELKSRKNGFGTKVVDSAYEVKMEKIRNRTNPSFLFLQYERPSWQVVNLFAIPRHVFFPDAVTKRKPLGAQAVRAGWVGSEILLDRLPSEARVSVIQNRRFLPQRQVLRSWAVLSKFGKLQPRLRGWTLDMWRLLRWVEKPEFTLKEAYEFEPQLKLLHPDNKHVKPKIRQQLQCLRDMGYVDFLGKGRYRIVPQIGQTKLG